jgi:F-type H+-transporting ATPase subunit a
MKKLVASLLAALVAATALPAQEHGSIAPQINQQVNEAAGAKVDIIMPHITDAHHMEVPCPWKWPQLACEVHLPQWQPLHLGPITVDLSPTKHVVMLLLSAFLACAVLITAARAHKRHSHTAGYPKGFSAGIEALVLYIRNNVILANVGPHGYAFVPILLTFFFMILFANLLGLIPFGATATGNIAVTATLAVLAFIVIEYAGMKAQGAHYINTIIYWNKDLALPLRILLFLIMTPVEILGKFTKPFALAVRLFANMTAGHVVVLAFIGMIFTFGSYLIGIAPLLMAIGIMVLELGVAFLQAFIFTLLVSVFIGQIRAAHH